MTSDSALQAKNPQRVYSSEGLFSDDIDSPKGSTVYTISKTIHARLLYKLYIQQTSRYLQG